MVDEKKEEKVADADVVEPVVDKGLVDEIDGAVEVVMSDVEKARREAAGEEELSEDDEKILDDKKKADEGGKTPDEGEGAGEVEKAKGADAPIAITDDNIERAVKAGMSIADARTFKDAGALERMCVMLESKSSKEEEGAREKSGEGEEGIDPLAAIPDLDPEQYDEKVVAGFKALKDIVRSQSQTIAGLVSGKGNEDASWFEGKVNALGDEFQAVLGKGSTSSLDPAGPQAVKRAELDEKARILAAGYKAAGKVMSRDVVFQEAVAVVLGEVVREVAQARKAESLKKRSGSHSARPVSNSTKEQADPFQDVADEIDRKHFGKK